VRQKLGGEVVADADLYWHSMREQSHPFFQQADRLWRLSLPSTAAAITVPGRQMMEWSGALRWLASDAPAASIRKAAAELGGQAMLFRSPDPVIEPFHPLAEPLLVVHRRLKQSFDPHHIFNPGRMYQEF
jgi:glycolate oxidase FAD binding subunit